MSDDTRPSDDEDGASPTRAEASRPSTETDRPEDPDATADVRSREATEDLPALRTTADYQFGAGAGEALFPPGEALTVHRSSSGRPSQILADEGRLVTYATDGRFTLGLAGGQRLAEAFAPPAGRVVVGDESEPFVRDGKNVFAKFVREVDDEIRPGDEVVVVHQRGDLLAVGRAELAADAMRAFDTGMAVKVREGAGEYEE